MARWRSLAGGVALMLALSSGGAVASDVADEADLAFLLGAQAYQRGEYHLALQQFLLSERLVPNKNVLFNIARSYEQLAKYPQAYRYYTDALSGEREARARAKIEMALSRLAERVGVLDITTNPPGATIYLQRKDLGAVGESPRRLGVEPGGYKVIAELEGYHPAEITLSKVEAAQRLPVQLELRQVLGTVVLSSPQGGQVWLDEGKQASCSVPCTLTLTPGEHRLKLTQTRHQSKELTVNVKADQTQTLTPKLELSAGALAVATDEPGALIRIDGRARGFTPALLTLSVGKHELIVERAGFRSERREVLIREGREAAVSIQLTPVDEVEAASRVRERVEQAPSSVSIITRQELDAFAFPTIAEALRGQPGIYIWDDLSYTTVGVRGLGTLGTYGNRLLVLSDGHPTNDNWIGSSYVGYDAMTDLANVERIELVRGPGSVLYGSNAFSGVINLISRERPPGVSVGIGTNQDGVARARLRTDAKLGEQGHVWGSVGGVRGQGRDFYFPEYEQETNGGLVRDKDGFEAGTVRGGVRYGWFAAQWWLQTHEKTIPTGEFETDINDPRMKQRDTRAFLELRAEPEPWDSVRLLSRAYVNLYQFAGRYPRQPDVGGLELDTYAGQWAGLEQRLMWTPLEGLRLTLGGEGQLHYQVDQYAQDNEGPFLDEERPFQVGALYGLVDADVTPGLRVSAGVRYDYYSSLASGGSINPRAAVIITPYNGGTLKFLGGKAFRAPSIYELYYDDGGYTQVQSPDLEPESIYSGEIEHTHRFSPTVVGVASVYSNVVSDLIVTKGEGEQSDPLYFANSNTPLVVMGGELQVRRDFRGGYMFGASYGVSRARFAEGKSMSDLLTLDRAPEKRRVANSPTHLASLRAAAPLLSRSLLASTRLSLEGTRFDKFENEEDPPQGHTEPAVIWDIVLSGKEPRSGLAYAFGVYNAFDWRYSIPASAVARQTTLTQSGRTFLASAEVNF